ncbi:alpha-tocopherol transfer protein-like isoform X2 [Choristoneura fumiferana]|uniref:alpha-tocopherol transfer protein-like isoform X2 n=1 Tax=Choristoneura fumiferana TaxID=7141 RepID=UPI003D1584A1
MYDIKTNAELAINSKLLLNSDEHSLRTMLKDHNIEPERLSEMLRNIQDWYNRQPHLPDAQLHDQLVTRLLIMRKFSLQKVKEKIDNYFTARNSMVDLLSNRDPLMSELNQYLKSGYWIVLPRKTPEKHRITIFKMKNCDGKSVILLIKVIFMIADYRLWNDTVMGEQFILDFENITIQLATQLTPVLISKIVFYVTSCIGAKLKGLHLVHLPKHAAFMFSLFKKLMKPKLVKRIKQYNSFEEAMREFPEDIFPNDLGGTDDVTCQEITDAWVRTLSSPDWRHYFLEQDSIRSDESKRISAKMSNFGIEGSFKTLNID